MAVGTGCSGAGAVSLELAWRGPVGAWAGSGLGPVVVSGCCCSVAFGGVALSAEQTGSSDTASGAGETASTVAEAPLFNDVHFHLSNYVQRGITARRYFEIVGDRVGRVAMFGIPLQQKWDYFVSGDRAPDYYLLSDAALYYYSFVDAAIAMEYRSLSDAQQARVDPMIHGIQPDGHVRRRPHPPGSAHLSGRVFWHRRVQRAQGVRVREGRGAHGEPAQSRARPHPGGGGRDRACRDSSLRHRPCARRGAPRPLRRLAPNCWRAHPGASVIWAHTGLGRFVPPAEQHIALLDEMLGDPRFDHVTMDISWDGGGPVLRE